MKQSQALEQDQSSEAKESSQQAPESRSASGETARAESARRESDLIERARGEAARADSLEVSSEEIAVAPYSDFADDEDDLVTLQMDAPLDDGEWMVQTSALERRRLSTEQLSAERASGALALTTRVWRNGMRAWTPLAEANLEAPPVVSTPGAVSLPGVISPDVSPADVSPADVTRSVSEDVALSVARPVVPPLAAPPSKRPVPAASSRPVPSRPVASALPLPPLPLPPLPLPPARLPAPPSRPAGAVPAALASRALPGLGLGVSPSVEVMAPNARALGSSPSFALPGAGASRLKGLSPPPPRVEARGSDPRSAAAPMVAEAGAARQVDTATSVALDVGSVVAKRSGPWGALFAQGAVAMVALLGTSYALTRAGVFEPGASGGGAPMAPVTSTVALQPALPGVQAAAVAPAALVEPAALSEPVGAASASEGAAEPANAVEAAAVAPASTSSPAETSETSSARGSESTPTADAEPAAKAAGESASASVDPSSRRAKRAARRAAALEARRTRAAAQSSGSGPERSRAEPERPEPASPLLEPGSTFDRAAAQAALAAAAEQAKNCRPIGGPSGAGMVQVQYEPSGKVGAVSIVTPGFENSEAADCIQMLFRRARVPAFNGTKGAQMRQRFEIP